MMPNAEKTKYKTLLMRKIKTEHNKTGQNSIEHHNPFVTENLIFLKGG